MLTWLKVLFSSSKIGHLIAILLLKSSCVIAVEILDKENQRKAYEFVKELNERTDIDNRKKQKLFNEKMINFAKSVGKKLNKSVINCLRELAVNVVKCESPNYNKETED